MITFNIRPFDGAGPLRFGMAPAEVHAVLGEPRSSRTNRRGELDEDYGWASAGYGKESGLLVELGFSTPACVSFQEVDLFRDASALEALLGADAAPAEGFGFIVFPSLGIALADFFSEQESDRTVIVFSEGRWSDLRGLQPYGRGPSAGRRNP